MTKQEVLDLLSQRSLLEVKKGGRTIKYIAEEQIFFDNEFHNHKNVYGVYYDVKNKLYKFFITDNDRCGMVEFCCKYNTEDEAFSGMYEYINMLYRTYNK